jgi:hypothetical protein
MGMVLAVDIAPALLGTREDRGAHFLVILASALSLVVPVMTEAP